VANTKRPDPTANDEALRLYVEERLSLAEIAERLKGQPRCSKNTLERRSSSEKWAQLRVKFDQQVAARAVDLLAGKPRSKRKKKAEPAPSAAPSVGGAAPAGGGELGAPPPAPPSVPPPPSAEEEAPVGWVDEWAAAVDRVAAARAKEVTERTERIGGMIDHAMEGASLAINEAVGWLSASRSKLVPVDGPGGGPPQLEIEHKDITIGQRAQASAMLAGAIGMLKNLMAADPVLLGRERMLSLRETQAKVDFLEKRIDGSLPPEKVQVEVERILDPLIAELKNRLDPSAFAHVLDALDRFAGTAGDQGSRGSVPAPAR